MAEFLTTISKSVHEFKRHPWLHGLSILTITVALTILGLFFLSYRNVSYWTFRASPKTTGTAYLQSGLSELEVSQLVQTLQSMSGIERVQYKSRGQILTELGGAYGQKDLRGEHLEDLFQDVVELRLQADLGTPALERLKMQVGALAGVLEVDFSSGWFSQLDDVRRTMNIAGWILMLGLFGGCSFLIANFMGMRHQSRKRDIEILQLLGGTRRHVLTPFLCEGLIEGSIGVVISLTLLLLVKIALSGSLVGAWLQKLGLQELLFLSPLQIMGIVLIGIVVALLSSLTVFLRVEEK